MVSLLGLVATRAPGELYELLDSDGLQDLKIDYENCKMDNYDRYNSNGGSSRLDFIKFAFV